MDFKEQEKLVILHVATTPKAAMWVKPDYFKVPEFKEIARSLKEHYADSPGLVPSLADIKSRLRSSGSSVTDSFVDTVFSEPTSAISDAWMGKLFKSWVKASSLYYAMALSIGEVRSISGTVDPDLVDTAISKVRGLIDESAKVDADRDTGKNFFDSDSHVDPPGSRLSSCHKFVDRALGGGYLKKSLVVYCGESNIGKSIWLANDAANYVRMGKNVAVVSAEMSDTMFVRRIGANLLNIDIGEYDAVAADPVRMKERLARLKESVIPPGALRIKEYPTSVATVPQVESFLKGVEDEIGEPLDVVVIDYVNILANIRNVNTENTYVRIKQIAEDLRAMAVRNNWVVITATQINRGGYDSTELTLSHIAESAGLSHTADIMYGIIQDMQMKTANEYWLKILKIRSGGLKNLKCKYSIDYSRMRLEETQIMVS